MTHFEYIFVAVSIVLSFTILRLLDALPTVFSKDRGYWVSGVWVLFLLLWALSFWWFSWTNRTLESMSFRYFLFLVAAPAILYLSATALVTASPASVESWRDVFFQNRRRFFLGVLLYCVLLTINSFLTFDVPLAHPVRVPQTLFAGLVALGAALPSERAQMRIAGVATVALVLIFGVVLSGQLPVTFE